MQKRADYLSKKRRPHYQDSSQAGSGTMVRYYSLNSIYRDADCPPDARQSRLPEWETTTSLSGMEEGYSAPDRRAETRRRDETTGRMKFYLDMMIQYELLRSPHYSMGATVTHQSERPQSGSSETPAMLTSIHNHWYLSAQNRTPSQHVSFFVPRLLTHQTPFTSAISKPTRSSAGKFHPQCNRRRAPCPGILDL